MKKKLISLKTREDYETGEILSAERVFIKTVKRDNFVRIFLDDIGLLGKCTQAESSIITCSLKYLDFNTNILPLTTQLRKDIAICANITINTFNITLGKLIKKNIFIKINGHLCLNPKLFFFGSDISREDMLKVTINYKLID